jgi:hypothetical protein
LRAPHWRRPQPTKGRFPVSGGPNSGEGSAESGERIDRIAAKLGLVTERDLAGTDAALLRSDLLAPTDFPAEPVAADRLQPALAPLPTEKLVV